MLKSLRISLDGKQYIVLSMQHHKNLPSEDNHADSEE